MDFFRRQNWDLVGKSWLWFTISGTAAVISIIVWVVMGLNLGIDFTGGGLIRYEFTQPIAATRQDQVEVLGKIRGALAPIGLDRAQVLVSGSNQLIIRTPPVRDDDEALKQEGQVREQIEAIFGAQYGSPILLGRETVGPVIGGDLRAGAVRAFLLGCVLILIFISIRYEFRFAVAAIVALLHDLILIIGAMAILQFELDSSFVAVLLTVIGYSINDTVVIFDRIRENMKLHRRSDFSATVNASLLQTMTRSINTGITTLIALISLAVLGGNTIQVFAIAMSIGVAFGCYSSIFNASQLLVAWERWAAQKRAAAAVGSSRRRTLERVSTNGTDAGVADEAVDETDTEAAASDAPARRMSAQEAMARAEEVAQEEKREERRERRKRQKARQDKKGKRRF